MTSLRSLGYLVAATCLACGSAPDPRPAVRSADARGRFIAHEPSGIVGEDVYSENEVTLSARVSDWRPHASTETTIGDDGGLIITGSAPHRSIESVIDTDASQIDWASFTFARRPLGSLLLQWTNRPGEDFTVDRSLSLGNSESVRFKSSTYGFDVGGHPLWKGRIDRLRLRISDAPDRPLTLEGASLGRRTATRNTVSALLPAWKVELGHEVRNALATLPGCPRVLRTVARPGVRFAVAVGLARTARTPVTFRVLLDDGSGRPDTLLERIVDPALGEHDTWHELSVGLGNAPARELRIVLESDIDDADQLATGAGWWAGPRIEGFEGETCRPNIVVFCIDTLRADRMSLFGNPNPTTTELERWIQRSGVVFETVVASAPWTLPSHVSIFSGVSALRHGVNHAFSGTPGFAAWERPRSVPLIAEILRNEGYHTAAFTGGGYLHPRWGFAHGFDRYAFWPDRRHAEQELAANLDHFERWASTVTGPWFAFVHTYEVHDPYLPRAGFFEAFAGGMLAPSGMVSLELLDERPDDGFRRRYRWVVHEQGRGRRALEPIELETVLPTLYDSHVAHADKLIGGLLNRWAGHGPDAEAIVVVTSDHGQVFGETPDAGHTCLHESTLRVPLLLALPGGPGAGRRIPGQVRLVDLVPTLLEAAGINAPADIDGVSLLDSANNGEPVPALVASSVASTANIGVSLRSADGRKIVFNHTAWHGAEPRSVGYDLERDPTESAPFPIEDPRLADLAQRLTGLLKERAPGLVMTATAGPDVPLAIRLGGPLVEHNGVKTMPGETANLEWQGPRRASMIVPAGDTVSLRFEKIFARHLDIETGSVGSTGAAMSRYSLPVLSVRDEGPVLLAVVNGVFVERDPSHGEPNGPTIAFVWVGSTTRGARTSELDSRLSRQLRTLGYLD